MSIKLSICIATYNRGAFISDTLDSILSQLITGVEIIVVDGASPDNTPEIMGRYVEDYPSVHYYRESENSGVDADFDKAVGYAKGDFCWLMTDDDLLRPEAIARVVSAINDEENLIVVNSEIRNTDLSEVYEKQRLAFDDDRVYRKVDKETFFTDTAAYLSFIGCVVIRRTFWLSRSRSEYYGSLFIHVGVILQSPPITNVRVIAQPLITIRYGNAMWTPRSFEIWMFKWPNLIWSFPDFSDTVKRRTCRQQPWRSVKALFHNRALGAYTKEEFKRFWPSNTGKLEYLIAYGLSVFPGTLANFIMLLYFSLFVRHARMALHDLVSSRNAGVLSRFLIRRLGIGR